MLRSDPEISFRYALAARATQATFPLVHRLRFSSPEVQFATKPIADPEKIRIPTRHGDVRALVYRPTEEDIAASLLAGRRPPAHLITHGGAFIVRVPEQEDNVARYLASEIGAYVVVPDFDTAPKVRHPVSEQQAYDVFVWVHENGERHGWDGERVSVGGASSGGQVAFSVVTQAIDVGGYIPVALSSEFGVGDISRPDEQRPSDKKRPIVSPQLASLVRNTYFVGADLTDPLVSPAYYPRLAEFPPTLIMTAEFDTLRHEMNDLAADMTAKGVQVTHKQFAGVDHGFTHAKPVEVARESLQMIGEHLRRAYASTTQEERNLAVVRRFIDGAVNGGDLAVIDETWAEDMVWHGGSMGTFEGRDAYKAFAAANTSGAWDDMHLEVHDVITRGDKVVLRFTNAGTNVGPFMGAPATGKRAEWLGVGIYTVRDGRIAEAWFAEDLLATLLQLDAIAPPA
jgi:acetyl esterase